MPRFRALPVAAAVAVLATALSGSAMVATAAGSSPAIAPRTVFDPASRLALSNWGGYIAQGTSGEFMTATADWTIATVTCNSKADLYAPWVGIDGAGDSTVEQTGVQTSCRSGSPVESAWYEMFPKPPVYFANPVSAGDVIVASVTYANGKYTLKISDKTQGWKHTVHKTLASDRLSAEAVIEAPGGGGTYPGITSVNFTDVNFNGQTLASFNPVASDTGTASVEYVPTAITNGDDFSVVPKA